MKTVVDRYFRWAVLMGSMLVSCSSGSSSTCESRLSMAPVKMRYEAKSGLRSPFTSLVAIIKKELRLSTSLYQILQVLSVTIFERTPILQALQIQDNGEKSLLFSNQLNLFDL